MVRLSFGASCLAWALALGCSGASDRPETARVSGKVTYRGKPVAGARVSFSNDTAPRVGSGDTDAEGRYQLTTYEPGDGAVVGNHVVTVYKSKIEVDATGPAPALDREAYLAHMDELAQKAMKAQQAGSALPAKYADRNTSDLRKDVRSGDNVIDLELSD